MSDTLIFSLVAFFVIVVFNAAMWGGIRKSRQTTKMFRINQLYEKYENMPEPTSKKVRE